MERNAAPEESETPGSQRDEQLAREREALRRRVRESLLRCPDPQLPPRA